MLTLDPKYLAVAGSDDVLDLIGPGEQPGSLAPVSEGFDGTEPLTCVLWPGGESAPVAYPAVAWGDGIDAFDPERPCVRIAWPLTGVIDQLRVGWWSGRVSLADLSCHLIEFRFQVLAGPDSAATAPRVGLHAPRDLRVECPWIDRLAESIDQAGFLEAAAEARDWIEGRAMRRVSACHRARYAAAMADPGIVTTGVGGRSIVKASVYYTLAQIFRRAVGMSNPPVDLIDASAAYEARADMELSTAYAEFDGLPRIAMGGIIVGRVTR